MKNTHPNTQSEDHPEHATGSERKPFVAPEVRYDGSLTQATAERSFTFGGPS